MPNVKKLPKKRVWVATLGKKTVLVQIVEHPLSEMVTNLRYKQKIVEGFYYPCHTSYQMLTLVLQIMILTKTPLGGFKIIDLELSLVYNIMTKRPYRKTIQRNDTRCTER